MANELPVRVQRTNLVVADLDRAFRVYRDILVPSVEKDSMFSLHCFTR